MATTKPIAPGAGRDLEPPHPGEQARDGRRGWIGIGLSALGIGLIVLWVGAWVVSVKRDALVLGGMSWIPPIPFIAGDFKVHIDHVARLQASGVDPYRKPGDWVCALYPYPPMVARCFSWVIFFDTPTAAYVWQGALGLILGVAGLAAWRTRRKLGLDSIPRSLIVALILFSSPVVFAVERGQSDPMIILPMIASAWLLGRKSTRAEVAAGAILGLTAWLKYYPGLAVVALLALGRWRGLAAFVVAAALVGIADFDGFRESVKHARQVQPLANPVIYPVHVVSHSIVGNWELVGFVRESPPLRQVPGVVAAAVLLLPAIFLVSRSVARSPEPGALAFPYLLWLSSAATFGLPYSNDYNLTTLPVAALAVWDRRDRWTVHLAILASILWSEPFRLPLSGEVLLGLKLCALYGVGASLASKASHTPAGDVEESHGLASVPRGGRIVRALDAPDPR